MRRAVAATLAAATAFATAFATACASAGKQLEQGQSAEARGDWFEAAARYADALEKEPTLEEARRGLYVAGDSAVHLGLRRARERTASDDPVGAAEELGRVDDLLARGREAGATIPTPDAWPTVRREAYDAAAARLTARADSLGHVYRWADARATYRRIRADFDPTADTERRLLDAEAALLVAWADAEAGEGRYRAAYQRAAEALALGGTIPREAADAASDVQQRSLTNGLRVLAVFPVGSTSQVREVAGADLEARLSDVLELEHWRRPPLFVAVADPVAVRQTTRVLFPGGATFRPGRVLEEVGADFGALVELTKLEVTESDLTEEERTARNSRGRPVSWTLVRGRVRWAIEVTVTIFDERGVRAASSTARSSESGRFERGRYGGSWQDLDLSRGERLLFDPAEQRRQRADLEEALLADLAAKVAEDVFGEVVRRIP
jgi:hypothetical protein